MADLQGFLRGALNYISAIEKDVGDRLPTMPGFDRDQANALLWTAEQVVRRQSQKLDPATRPIPNGGHMMVWARPKNRNWAAYDGTNGLGLHNDEFRPCLLEGSGHGRRIVIHGEGTHFPINEFEIAEDVVR